MRCLLLEAVKISEHKLANYNLLVILRESGKNIFSDVEQLLMIGSAEMLIEGIDPVIFTLGPLTVRWYGLMMALSFAFGVYYLIKNGKKIGYDEDLLLLLTIVVIISAIAGARAIYVLTNWPFFAANPQDIIRIDKGGLAFHGGLLGGFLSGWLFTRRHRLSFRALLDLSVPGIAIGIMLVRIANIFNQEILGRATLLFPFERHPTQVYGSLIGLFLLLQHNYLARKGENPPGYLFWSFVFSYSLLRGLIEETFRANPLYLWGYISEVWGAGFFTLTHLATPPLLILSWLMLRKIKNSR
ncbi:MAG: prolipoprotein diacylglyceryl transferase [Dethiobacteria bacterium]